MSRDHFDRAYEIVIDAEGGYSDDPHDPGNWTGGQTGLGELAGTMRGISAAAYPDLDIRNLTDDEIYGLYRRDYWDRNRCGEMPWGFGLMTFDCGVNQGTDIGARLLQDAVGIVPDGEVGPHTIATAYVATYRQLARFNALRAIRYMGTRNADRYLNGWLVRLAIVTMEASRS